VVAVSSLCLLCNRAPSWLSCGVGWGCSNGRVLHERGLQRHAAGHRRDACHLQAGRGHCVQHGHVCTPPDLCRVTCTCKPICVLNVRHNYHLLSALSPPPPPYSLPIFGTRSAHGPSPCVLVASPGRMYSHCAHSHTHTCICTNMPTRMHTYAFGSMLMHTSCAQSRNRVRDTAKA